MPVLNDRLGPSAFSSFEAFGANEAYCDKTYPPGTSAQVDTWNSNCKKSCSGLKCVTSPGLLASPWTVVGKNARGLPDDSLLGSILATVRPGGARPPAGGGAPPPGASESSLPFELSQQNLLLIGGGLALFLFMKSRKGGRGGAFRGYSKQNRRARRSRRGSKRRGI